MPLNIDFQQIFLHLLNFTLLFAILYYLLYAPVKNFMAKREAFYADQNKEAAAHLESALHDKEEYAALKASADEEILQEKEKVRRELDELYTRKVRQAEDEAAKILANARQEAEREKTNIIQSAQAEISEMVTAATEKIVLQASASEAFEQFLDAAEGGMNDDTIYQ
ncbi:MAG: ATP synthase F0 subunit B [Firmicutes bacterium]|nr:ATP synthase F0 subunit B [Bacillota bacterium]